MRSLLVFDGAMGSLLYERGIFVTQNFEQLNVTRPDVVAQDPRGLRRRRREGHRDQHVRRELASASTATASATRCARINLAGARLAREAAGRGRVRRPARWARPGSSPAWRRRRSSTWPPPTFAEQAAALVEGGVDLLVLETFRHLDEIRIAHRGGAAGRARHADHRVDGLRPERDGRRRVRRPSTSPTTLRDWGADAHRRELRRRPAARARHRRAHARASACRSACSRTPGCRARSTAASSTWRRPSTSTCSRGA